jgi:hypothetical protein
MIDAGIEKTGIVEEVRRGEAKRGPVALFRKHFMPVRVSIQSSYQMQEKQTD